MLFSAVEAARGSLEVQPVGGRGVGVGVGVSSDVDGGGGGGRPVV